jgi:hypothetical protein
MVDRQQRASRQANVSGQDWSSQQATQTPADVSQLHTQRLQYPAPQRPFPAQRYGLARAPASRPTMPPPVLPDPRAEAIATHLKEAIRLRKDAETLLDNLQVCSAHAADASERWLAVVHLIGRTPEQVQAYHQLEKQILEHSRELASLRQRWSACVAQAREHEEIARLMQGDALR